VTNALLGQFVIVPSPDHPGWSTFDLDLAEAFNSRVIGPMIARREGERTCRLRCFPRTELRNLMGGLHGGALLGFIDVSLFAGMQFLTDSDAGGGITIDLSTQFIGAGRIDRPLDAVIEVLRETGRLLFLRGLLEQDGELVCSYSGTIRKPGKRI